MDQEKSDAAIIGMGPAGLTAAIYLKRSGVDPTCFEQSEVGGKLNSIHEIENYPGFLGSGVDLADKLRKQAEYFKLDIRRETVNSVNRQDDGTFLVMTSKKEYVCRAVLIAVGIREKPFDVKGSQAYYGNGISRCAECDGPFYRGKPVAVIGDSASALHEAEYLTTICGKVYLISPEENLKASQDEVDNFSSISNVELIRPYRIIGSEGKSHLQKLYLESKDGRKRELEVDALFVFLGSTPITEFLGYMDVMDDKGMIKTDDRMRTSVPGLFAAGDARVTSLRQVVTAVGDGGLAGVNMRAYLRTPAAIKRQ